MPQQVNPAQQIILDSSSRELVPQAVHTFVALGQCICATTVVVQSRATLSELTNRCRDFDTPKETASVGFPAPEGAASPAPDGRQKKAQLCRRRAWDGTILIATTILVDSTTKQPPLCSLLRRTWTDSYEHARGSKERMHSKRTFLKRSLLTTTIILILSTNIPA